MTSGCGCSDILRGVSRTIGENQTVPKGPSSLVALILGNVLGGIGVASGIAVGSLLVASMGGTALAGVAQAVSVLGAAVLAVPLATLAAKSGRRRALTTGYAIAAAGGVAVLAGAALDWLLLLFAGLTLFGSAQASNLQSRYAAAELATPARRGTTMSVVIWATTVGSVLGPNLSGLGGLLGQRLGVPELAGPYLFSVAGFVLACAVLAIGYTARTIPTGAVARRTAGALRALRWAAHDRRTRFGVVVIVTAHAVMVAIMSMTPVHLGHHGHGLTVVGLVISLHILGMYALSPVMGWLNDRIGPVITAYAGLVLLLIAAVLALFGANGLGSVTAALIVLGVGWSAATVSGAVVLAGVENAEIRVPLQGGTDALMNYGAAAAALLSGPLLAGIGFGGLSAVAGALVVPAALLGWGLPARRTPAPVVEGT